MLDGDVLIDRLESVLGTKFEREYMSRMKFHPDRMPMTIEALHSEFASLDLPKKPRSEIRPALWRPSSSPWIMGAGSSDRLPLSEVKKILLYSDSVALDIACLLGRLRIFRITQETDDQILSNDLEVILTQLSEVSQLVRRGFVLPFNPTRVRDRHPIGERYDPMFPNQQVAHDYLDGMKCEIHAYDSRDVRRPFFNSVMLSVPSIDHGNVSWSDLISLREDEAIFGEWRLLIHGILDRLYTRREEFTDFEEEFKMVAAAEFRMWEERFAVQRMRRTAFGALFRGAKQIAIQWIGGALAGGAMAAVLGKTAGAAIVGAVAGAGPSALSMLSQAATALSRREATLSLEHHILTLPVDRRES